MKMNNQSLQAHPDYERFCDRFMGLFDSDQYDKENLITVFKDLFKRYTERHRYYHTIYHVEKMLNFIDLYKEQVIDYEVVSLAIWFHDVIYDIKSIPNGESNEEKSAAHAVTALGSISYDSKKIAKIQSYILATDLFTAGYDDRRENDLCMLLDADLIGLASDRNIFQQDGENITKENEMYYDMSHIVKKRREFAEMMLDKERRPCIFHTKFIQQKYEEKARKNLASLLEGSL